MSDNINSLPAGKVDDKPDSVSSENSNRVTGRKKNILLASLFTNFFVLLALYLGLSRFFSPTTWRKSILPIRLITWRS